MRHPLHRLVVVLACTVASAWCGAQAPSSAGPKPQQPARSPRLQPGDTAPAFAVTGPDGGTLRLSDLEGKIVIVDVSATWCGPCQAAMPNNDRVYRKYADQGVVLVGVTADDTKDNYDAWVKRNADKYRFTMYFDPAGKDGWDEDSVFANDYHVTGFPTMFVIGRDGKLVQTVFGGGPGEDYRLEYALARAGAKVDLASLPPEEKRDGKPASIPMVKKTKAIPMIGMGGARSAELVPSEFGSVERGQQVPECKFEGIDGKPVELSSLRGKRVLLHFATSNGPQPWFTDFLDSYGGQDLAGFLVFSACDRDAFETWTQQHPNPGFTVAWDPSGKAWAENVLNTAFGIGMYPATAVIDADGKMVGGLIGMGDRAALIVKGLLEASGVALSSADHDQVAVAEAAMRKTGTVPDERPPLLGAGETAPDFVSQDAAGNDVKLADFAGKVVVLDFWATWCGPCQASMPHTQSMAQELKDQGVVVLAVCTSDTRANFEKWVAANQEKYADMRFVCEPNERGSKTFEERASKKLYHVRGIPTKFVIGRDGKILGALVGYEEGDVRTEAVLAKAGVKIDPDVVSKGDKQLADDAAKEGH